MERVIGFCPCGEILGRDHEDYIEYRGIRYANAKRFAYPVPVTSWKGVYDATEYKDCAFQRRSFEDDAVCNEFYHKEFRENQTFTYSEDCFYLNIWCPKNIKNAPVIIYIHGGSFTGGSSNESHISGIEFARQGIVFVSFNYRLGPFGFCSHPALTDEKGRCGNYGLYDQYTAIQWVRENIKAFGGNPKNITLMGQSAGAMSVDIHSTCPLESHWFSGCMMSSGAGLQRFVLRPRTPKRSEHFWNVVMKNANCTSIEKLREVDPKTLYYAWYDACKSVTFSLPYTLPVYDGQLLTKETFSKKKLADLPYMLGMTSTDMMPHTLRRLVKRWNRLAQSKNKKPCYTYLFSRNLPGDDSGAWHSSDLLYYFSTLDHNWRPFEDIDYEISFQMSQALMAFADTANPNCEAIPPWKSNHAEPMNFSEDSRQQKWNSIRIASRKKKRKE